jgi:hypothetical protein
LKFDDLALHYQRKEDEDGQLILIQAKNRNGPPIDLSHLTNEGGDYCLYKYYTSFKNITENTFKGVKLENLILLTTLDVTETFEQTLEQIQPEKMLLFNKQAAKQFRMKANTHLSQEIIYHLDPKIQIARELVKRLGEKKRNSIAKFIQQ